MSLRIEVKLRKLTSHDRCDRCGARAQVLVRCKAGELVFCGHHAAQHSPALINAGYPITSETESEEKKHGTTGIK